MDLKTINIKVNNFINVTLPNFFKNLPQTLKELPDKFKKLTLQEQIAYGCIVLGGILIIISLFLF